MFGVLWHNFIRVIHHRALTLILVVINFGVVVTQGACYDNVIPGGKLSSGYYEYSAVGSDGFIVLKPEGEG